jgi:outer membrane autotransporter protein
LFAGATFNYLSGDTDFGGDAGSADVDSYVFGFHSAKYWDNDVFLEGLFTLGQFDLETRRVDGFDLMRYDASPEGNLYSADLALGQVHSRGRWRVTPLAKLLYLDGSIDGYRENDPSGSGSPETFEKQDFDALNLALSLQTDYVVLQNWGVLIPSLKVAYHHEFSDRHAVRSVRFGVPFSQTTDEPDSHTAVVRIGASAQFKRGWSGFASYEKLFGHDYLDRDNVVLGARYEFF